MGRKQHFPCFEQTYLSIIHGGGVCLYLRNYNYTERNDLVPPSLEAACLEIYKQNSKPFLIATIYRPPACNLDFFSELNFYCAN